MKRTNLIALKTEHAQLVADARKEPSEEIDGKIATLEAAIAESEGTETPHKKKGKK